MLVLRRDVAVQLVPCPCCARTVAVRWPERWRYCDACGERAEVAPVEAAALS